MTDCESDETSRSPSEMDEHSDTESDQHSNDHDRGEAKRGILKSRPNSCPGILDILDEDAKARWTACDETKLVLLRQRSSSSLSNSSSKSVPRRRRVSYANKSTDPSRRPQSAKRPETETKKSNVVSFSRSLKLLGLQPEDFGIKKPEVADNVTRARPRRTMTRAPIIHTRVLERSVSLDALRSAIHESASSKKYVSTEQLDRETIAKAVYEEWYFRKLEEARRKKELLLIEERIAKEQLARARAERIKKAEENFALWKESKLKERPKVGKKEPARLRPEAPAPVSQEKVDQVFQAWKKEKEKLKALEIKSKQLELEKEKEKEKAREEKRKDALNTFNAWKKQADEKLRKKHLAREMKKRAEEEAKKYAKNHAIQEEEGTSRTTFEHWKKMKDDLEKEKAKVRLSAAQTAEERKEMRQVDRLYEAEQAFEEWLDSVEERELRRARAHRARAREPGPPWTP